MRSASEYKAQIQALLPPGRLWDALRVSGSLADDLLAAQAEEFARVDARADDLLDEADPRTALELLVEWEVWAGLPDSCIGNPDTIFRRQLAVVSKLTAVGGQSRAYFVGLAASLGYEITITEFSARRYGASYGTLYGGLEWNFVWQVNAPATTIINRLYGRSFYGEPYRTWGYQQLECAIEALKPAHTQVLFSYGG